jgi:hypothetical protein
MRTLTFTQSSQLAKQILSMVIFFVERVVGGWFIGMLVAT